MKSNNKAIGGYNSLRIDSTVSDFEIPECNYQSARSALYAYLEVENPNKVYIPNYMCESLNLVFDSLNINVEKYQLNDQLLPCDHLSTDADSVVIVVNYFGLLDEVLFDWINENSRHHQILLDNSQAFFCLPHSKSPTIYSPRKFLPVADGGWIITNTHLDKPKEKWDSSKNITHLVMRSFDMTEEGYNFFISAEQALDNITPRQMSTLTKNIILSCNLSHMSEIRNKNYIYYDSFFSGLNKSKVKNTGKAPLCYPLQLEFDISELHRKLCEERIYTARYWNISQGDLNRVHWYNKTIFLPVDDSLCEKDLDFVIGTIKEFLNYD